jgi:DNA repair photolyase
LTIVTKSCLVERDIDLLAEMASKSLVKVYVSITSLDNRLARKLEPRTTAPHRRLEVVQNLRRAKIPAGVMFAPVIPVINDTEMENVLDHAAAAGALSAGYVMLRLPHEVKLLFREWLRMHYPLKEEHVMNMVKDIRGGRENDPNFTTRMSGQGVYAAIIEQRFRKACARLGLNRTPVLLDTNAFKRPVNQKDQLELF